MKATEMLHILKVQNKRMFIIIIILIIAFIALLGYTIFLLNDIGVEETQETVSQDNENGSNNFIGNDGDIING